MAEGKPKFFIQVPENKFYGADGTSTEVGRIYHSDDVTQKEVAEVLSEAHHVDSESVILADTEEELQQKARRARKGISVAFSSNKWNSSWAPKGVQKEDINPNLN